MGRLEQVAAEINRLEPYAGEEPELAGLDRLTLRRRLAWAVLWRLRHRAEPVSEQ